MKVEFVAHCDEVAIKRAGILIAKLIEVSSL